MQSHGVLGNEQRRVLIDIDIDIIHIPMLLFHKCFVKGVSTSTDDSSVLLGIGGSSKGGYSLQIKTIVVADKNHHIL